ncbi:hypothetical protein IWQ60_002187 [Tieghemiomyces parasiticus]|uniref:FHF complex subunit HOOK-interacting protein C-terminal domain-containing protein n=1 Tax=Tieghemiomyces parasiticus TaxID=78921 RepID=A0A9W8AJW1_9FUNG|nr:hypothetical protein IWQ60_002187 [Tieghemiomyces parasiticus]
MDIFARLTKKIATPKKEKPTSAMRLAKFEKAWDYIHHLKAMVDMLVEEEHQPEAGDNYTGVCLEYFLRKNVLASLVHLSEADCPVGLLGETIRTISSLVELLDVRFLVHKNVHTPLLSLLRLAMASPQHSNKYQEDLVDLTYLLCAKIHEYPEILHIFFLDRSWLSPAAGSGSVTPSTASSPSRPADSPVAVTGKEYEFLLFTYLLQFVHMEGKAGDYARTGLGFLIELTGDKDLSDYILRSSGLSTILSASMGALYSQLPRRLLVMFEEDLPATGGAAAVRVPAVATTAGLTAAAAGDIHSDVGPTGTAPDTSTLVGRTSLSEEDELREEPTDAMESSTSPEFHQVMTSFIKLAEFYQDVLYRCPNITLHRSLVRNFRTHFLETVLYPSIMESSDTDGTAVAVMSYIELLLQALQPGELTDTLLRFLLDAEDEPASPAPASETAIPAAAVPSAQSEADVAAEKPAAVAFNLKDLICTNLQSSSRTAVVAALKLWTTMLTFQCAFTPNLLDTQPARRPLAPATTWPSGSPGQAGGPKSLAPPPVGLAAVLSHRYDMESYTHLLRLIDGTPAPTPILGYETYLADTEAAWEDHVVYHGTFEHVHQMERARAMLAAGIEQPLPPPPRSRRYGSRHDGIASDGGDQSTMTGATDFGSAPGPARPCCTPYRLNASDPALRALFNLLARFFAHPVDVNLALTGAVAALAACPFRELEGLFTFEAVPAPAPTVNANATTAGPRSSPAAHAPLLGDRGPWSLPPGAASPPSIFSILLALAQRVQAFRESMTDFEDRLRRTRTSLALGTTTAMTTPYPAKPTARTSVLNTPGATADSTGRSALLPSPTAPATTLSLTSSSIPSLQPGRAGSATSPDARSGGSSSPATAASTLAGGAEKAASAGKVAYATLCENVLILEESIKEMLAIIQVRRSVATPEVETVALRPSGPLGV